MDWLALLLKLLHVAIAIVFIGGAVGRTLVLRRAARAESVEVAYALSHAAEPFEKMAVQGSNLIIPAGMAAAWAQGYEWFGLTTGWMLASTLLLLSVVPLVVLVFLPRGRVFERELADARAAGAWTPGLRAAFADRLVALARNWEFVIIIIIVFLMVTKPF